MNAVEMKAIANVTKSTNAKTTLNGYEIDFPNRTFYFGKKFMKLAQQYGTKEYNTFLGMIRDLPDFKIVVREPKKSETRMSTKGLTREFMELHIRTMKGEGSEEYKEFKNQLAYSEGQINPYMYLRKWFLDNYPNWDGKEEQRKEAKKQRDAEKARLMVIRNDADAVAEAAEKAAEAAVAAQSGADSEQ